MVRLAILAALVLGAGALLAGPATAQTTPAFTNGGFEQDPFATGGEWDKVPGDNAAVQYRSAQSAGITARSGSGWVGLQAADAIPDPGAGPSGSVSTSYTRGGADNCIEELSSSNQRSVSFLQGDRITFTPSSSLNTITVTRTLRRGASTVSSSGSYTVATSGVYTFRISVSAGSRSHLDFCRTSTVTLTYSTSGRTLRGQTGQSAEMLSKEYTVAEGDTIGLDVYVQVPARTNLIGDLENQAGTLLRSETVTPAAGWQLLHIPRTVIAASTTQVRFRLRLSADDDGVYGTRYGGVDDAVLLASDAGRAPTPTPTSTPAPEGAGYHGLMDTRAYAGVLDPGDLLLTSSYHIGWVTYPDLAIDAVPYIYQVVKDGVVAGRSVPYAFYDAATGTTNPLGRHPDGYDGGIVSLYLAPAERRAGGLCGGTAPACEPVGADILLLASPLTGVVTRTTDTLTTNDYVDSEDLPYHVAQNLAALEAAWRDNPVLTVNGRLTETGAAYMDRVIPNLRTMAPDSYAASVTAMNLPSQPPPAPSSLAVSSRERAGGGAIQEATDSLADSTGLDGDLVRGVIGAGIAFAITAFFVSKFGGGAGLAVAVVVNLVLYLPAAMYGGLIPWQAAASVLALLGVAAVLFKVRDWVTTT